MSFGRSLSVKNGENKLKVEMKIKDENDIRIKNEQKSEGRVKKENLENENVPPEVGKSGNVEKLGMVATNQAPLRRAKNSDSEDSDERATKPKPRAKRMRRTRPTNPTPPPTQSDESSTDEGTSGGCIHFFTEAQAKINATSAWSKVETGKLKGTGKGGKGGKKVIFSSSDEDQSPETPAVVGEPPRDSAAGWNIPADFEIADENRIEELSSDDSAEPIRRSTRKQTTRQATNSPPTQPTPTQPSTSGCISNPNDVPNLNDSRNFPIFDEVAEKINTRKNKFEV